MCERADQCCYIDTIEQMVEDAIIFIDNGEYEKAKDKLGEIILGGYT